MSYEGTNRLGRCLQKRMKELDTKPPIAEFGEILGNMSLVTNFFPVPIPQGDYEVCRAVSRGPSGGFFAETTVAGVPGHTHSVIINNNMRSIRPGDRVLVNWIEDTPCVIDIIGR